MIHKVFLHSLLLAFGHFSVVLMGSAQNVSSYLGVKVAEEEEEDIVHESSHVDTPATYPDRAEGLMLFIAQNVVYPSSAIENNVQGTVMLRFKVDVDGSVNTIQIVRSLSKECDKAAVDVVAKLKRFVPAKKDEKAVAVWYMLPIRFRME